MKDLNGAFPRTPEAVEDAIHEGIRRGRRRELRRARLRRPKRSEEHKISSFSAQNHHNLKIIPSQILSILQAWKQENKKRFIERS